MMNNNIYYGPVPTSNPCGEISLFKLDFDLLYYDEAELSKIENRQLLNSILKLDDEEENK